MQNTQIKGTGEFTIMWQHNVVGPYTSLSTGVCCILDNMCFSTLTLASKDLFVCWFRHYIPHIWCKQCRTCKDWVSRNYSNVWSLKNFTCAWQAGLRILAPSYCAVDIVLKNVLSIASRTFKFSPRVCHIEWVPMMQPKPGDLHILCLWCSQITLERVCAPTWTVWIDIQNKHSQACWIQFLTNKRWTQVIRYKHDRCYVANFTCLGLLAVPHKLTCNLHIWPLLMEFVFKNCELFKYNATHQ